MKISIIANCHGVIISNAIRALNPSITINGYFTVGDAFSESNLEKTISVCQQSDLVFNMAYNESKKYFLSKDVIYFPSIIFPVFHPDIHSVCCENKLLQSVYTNLNSRIIFESFQNGLSEDQACKRFNEDVYQEYGYLNIFEESIKGIEERFAQVNLDVHSFLAKWFRYGCFMHLSMHPMAFAVVDIVQHLFQLRKIKILNPNPHSFVEDSLSGIVWPVYPEIAKKLALKDSGSYIFKPGPYRFMTLKDFVSATYAAYRQTPYDLSQAILKRWI